MGMTGMTALYSGAFFFGKLNQAGFASEIGWPLLGGEASAAYQAGLACSAHTLALPPCVLAYAPPALVLQCVRMVSPDWSQHPLTFFPLAVLSTTVLATAWATNMNAVTQVKKMELMPGLAHVRITTHSVLGVRNHRCTLGDEHAHGVFQLSHTHSQVGRVGDSAAPAPPSRVVGSGHGQEHNRAHQGAAASAGEEGGRKCVCDDRRVAGCGQVHPRV